MWPPSRIHEAKPEVSPACKLCGEPWADETHLNWKCCIILADEDPRIQSTNYFAKYTTRQLDVGKNEIYWNRGLGFPTVSSQKPEILSKPGKL